MKLFSSVLLFGLVNGWSQPSYKEARRIINQRSSEPWGRPVNHDRKLQSRLWSDCPPAPIPANANPPKCQGSTCLLRCKPGFVPSGRKRIACRRKPNSSFQWLTAFGTCKTCDDQNPKSNDANMISVCKTNPKNGRKFCTLKCPPGQPIIGLSPSRTFTKLACKCPRGKCAWMKGRKTVNYQGLTCRAGGQNPKPTKTTTTTKRATTKQTTPSPPEENGSQNGELSLFERGGPHLTASQSCDVNQFGRFFGDSKIINGVTAGRAAWPWIVSMSFFRFEFGGAALCGGSIISDKWIISAAHCCRSSVKVQITVGEFNRMAVDSGQFTVTSRTMIIHPKYQSGNGMDWDACLIKVPSLKQNAPTSCKNCFTAACIPQVAPRHGRHCWVAGWGHTKEGSGIATRLQEVGVNLFSWSYCTTKSTYGTIVNKAAELCAGIPDGFHDGNLDGFVDGGKDACQGDSGGPLVCNDNGAATMYGLVSWGEGCARRGKPGIYVDVFAIKGWIQTTIRNN